jgi:hypothetical protein
MTNNQMTARDAYIYGFPLVLMDVSKQVMTHGKPGESDWKAPLNQFAHPRTFPDDTFTDVVTPNVDTLYSSAWLDLSQGPIVLSVPDTNGRYYLLQMMDAWTNVFASPGKRTTGTVKGEFVIVGPTWNGELPAGMKKIQAPTEMVWIIGRTQTNGKSDYDAVHAIQDGYRLRPLSGVINTALSEQNIDIKTAPVDQAFNLGAKEFFERLANLMIENPPSSDDKPMIDSLASIGLIAGKAFTVSPELEKDLAVELTEGKAAIKKSGEESFGPVVNGWSITGTGNEQTGVYGTQYLWRATVALLGLGANLTADAIYPHTTVDLNGQPLNGENKYVLHFDKADLPPANAFWSLTLYNARQFLVKNAIERFALGDRDKLKFNSDGSLDIQIQNEDPGVGRRDNWLPAPKDGFNLFLRVYWPKPEALDERWTIPGVQNRGQAASRSAA